MAKNAYICFDDIRGKMGKTIRIMRFRLLYAMLALLGFGTSCSGVRHAGKTAGSPTDIPADGVVGESTDTVRLPPPIRLMYGVLPAGYRHQPSAEEAHENSSEEVPEREPDAEGSPSSGTEADRR